MRKYILIQLFFFPLFCLSLVPSNALASKIRPQQTTRTTGNSGAATGSILFIESALNNPAPAAFFQESMFYFQHHQGKITSANSNLRLADNNPQDELKGNTFVITDSSNSISKGAFSYQNYEENQIDRTQFGLSLASLASKESSLGLSYRYTKDDHLILKREEKFHQIGLGGSYIYNEDLSFGFVIENILNAKQTTSKAILGSQYTLNSFFTFIADLGIDYRSSASSTTFYAFATQLTVFKDFQLRFGLFEDNIFKLKGNSSGISWIGPKLIFDISFKNSKNIDSLNTYLYEHEELKETSFAITYRI